MKPRKKEVIMKRLLFLLVLVVGCGKSPAPPVVSVPTAPTAAPVKEHPEALVGRWRSTINDVFDWTFQADGTAVSRGGFSEKNGTWHTEGNELILNFGAGYSEVRYGFSEVSAKYFELQLDKKHAVLLRKQ
jgi:hypothetical protein